jgi:hypothetical protein
LLEHAYLEYVFVHVESNLQLVNGRASTRSGGKRGGLGVRGRRVGKKGRMALETAMIYTISDAGKSSKN